MTLLPESLQDIADEPWQDVHPAHVIALAIAVALFVMWAVITFYFDRQVYMIFTPGSLRVREEIGGALSYYYNKHNLKVQADYRQLKDDAANSGAGTTNKEFRLQTQFIF